MAYLFVHGYNNTFENGVTTIAQIWHFLGREGVALTYSWPAGRGGLRGYFTDRESGEFTIFHLKQFLRDIVASPDVERLDIIGHSRGTDVVLTAMRELYLEAKGRERDNNDLWKVGNLVLAAPDVDMEVFSQRVGAEGLFALPHRFTVYLSDHDRAIGLSTWLFGSVRRLGRLRKSDLSEEQRARLAEMQNLHLVDALGCQFVDQRCLDSESDPGAKLVDVDCAIAFVAPRLDEVPIEAELDEPANGAPVEVANLVTTAPPLGLERRGRLSFQRGGGGDAGERHRLCLEQNA